MGAGIKFVMTFAVFLVAVSAMSVDMNPEQSGQLQIHGCYWDGTAPLCEGNCRDGWSTNATDRCGDGKCCVTGQKAYCCPPFETPADCYWSGEAPFCSSGCNQVGYKSVMIDQCGDGKCCSTGRKVLCCRE